MKEHKTFGYKNGIHHGLTHQYTATIPTIIMNTEGIDSTSNTAPKRQCLQRDNLMQENTTFSKWVEADDNVYISRNLNKYYKKGSKPESIWTNPYQTGYRNGETEADLVKFGEYVKKTPHLWDSLDTLGGKTLGCWCKKEKPCHADILITLFKEKNHNNTTT